MKIWDRLSNAGDAPPDSPLLPRVPKAIYCVSPSQLTLMERAPPSGSSRVMWIAEGEASLNTGECVSIYPKQKEFYSLCDTGVLCDALCLSSRPGPGHAPGCTVS